MHAFCRGHPQAVDGILTMDEIVGYSEEHQREIRVMSEMDT